MSDQFETYNKVKRRDTSTQYESVNVNVFSITLNVEGHELGFDFELPDWNTDHVERVICEEIASIDKLDLSILGWKEYPTICMNTLQFSGQLEVADYNYQEDCDINHRALCLRSPIAVSTLQKLKLSSKSL